MHSTRYIGIGIGASSVQIVAIDENKNVLTNSRQPHNGAPLQTLQSVIDEFSISENDFFCITGRWLRYSLPFETISEPEAIESALKSFYTKENFPDFVVSIGGESLIAYEITSDGSILTVYTGNKCAAGTGEFFLQQIKRMGLTVDEACEIAQNGKPHRIAGRCSVFCKSDCTHALNKGEPKENICAGLCLMMADKIKELLKDRKPKRLMPIGGGTLNKPLIDILRSRYEEVILSSFSPTFEAYGAALWCLDKQTSKFNLEIFKRAIKIRPKSFDTLPPLKNAERFVSFKEPYDGKVEDGDKLILGLDVGSTTTKALLMRNEDNRIVARAYLRTNGDPVGASRRCYAELSRQLTGKNFSIIALGVTGSGRQIAGLHALASVIINEIIAHATAAAFFDPELDTIFEIGGQDAKYTYLSCGVPADYAMNEACSAGTGSFLEESAGEYLGVKTEDIANFAIQAEHPLNFSDQCAAFISSDLNQAAQEGANKNDLLAGLVYSICMNYLNRVKGSRPVGKKVFMQGGVCYNRAVPLAMASLMQSPIIVPPDPGLMGAFGVALETKKRLDSVTIVEGNFSLDELATREIERLSEFTCPGEKNACDRKCIINRYRINGKIYPFGGICNKYYNIRQKSDIHTENLDFVLLREKLLFAKFAPQKTERKNFQSIGMLKTFLTHSLYPLFAEFFSQLGFNVVLSDKINEEGFSRTEAPFCYPAEQSHGAFLNLLSKKTDFIFLPHITNLPVNDPENYGRPCVLLQGEAYYLKTTFREEIENYGAKIISPVLNFRYGYNYPIKRLTALSEVLKRDKRQIENAWKSAVKKQLEFEDELKKIGKKALAEIESNPDTLAIVLFGRPYNAFNSDGNMGIPHKVASRGFRIIPFDMLPSDHAGIHEKMYWALGRKILAAANTVKNHPQLFGFFITNFSCGPDSFVIPFFRKIMEPKPSLTLELDQHTADAGIDTRIEAALDIMQSYKKQKFTANFANTYVPTKIVNAKPMKIFSSDGRELSIHHHDVEVLIPPMDRFGTEAVATSLRSANIHAKSLPQADQEVLSIGRRHSSCKECLPYQLTTGAFLKYLLARKDRKVVSLCFLTSADGPCRFGQYTTALEQKIHELRIPNATVFSLSDANGYAGIGVKILLRSWQAVILADAFNDIKAMLEVSAKDPESAVKILDHEWQKIINCIEKKQSLETQVKKAVEQLKTIPLARNPAEIPVISLVGEIYVRRDDFSRRDLMGFLQKKGFMVRTAPVAEYMLYANYLAIKNIDERNLSPLHRFFVNLRNSLQEYHEQKFKKILSKSGLFFLHKIDIPSTLSAAEPFLDPKLVGEAAITIGLSLLDINSDSCGVISLGPFGCMPSRIAESVLKKRMRELSLQSEKKIPMPYLAIETDGSPLSQLSIANLEAFSLQALRRHEKLKKHGISKH